MATGRASMTTLLAALLSVAACWAGLNGLAFALEPQSSITDTLNPVIPKGIGDHCVADTEFMRRNHMDMLKHHRDETVIDGIRSKQYDLNECISCHAVKGPGGQAVTISDPKHFCRACHDYAAVSIDCFQCHASRPDRDALNSPHDDVRKEAANP